MKTTKTTQPLKKFTLAENIAFLREEITAGENWLAVCEKEVRQPHLRTVKAEWIKDRDGAQQSLARLRGQLATVEALAATQEADNVQ